MVLDVGRKSKGVEMLQEPAWRARETGRARGCLHLPAKEVGADEMIGDLLLRGVVATEV